MWLYIFKCYEERSVNNDIIVHSFGRQGGFNCQYPVLMNDFMFQCRQHFVQAVLPRLERLLSLLAFAPQKIVRQTWKKDLYIRHMIWCTIKSDAFMTQSMNLIIEHDLLWHGRRRISQPICHRTNRVTYFLRLWPMHPRNTTVHKEYVMWRSLTSKICSCNIWSRYPVESASDQKRLLCETRGVRLLWPHYLHSFSSIACHGVKWSIDLKILL